LVGSNCDAFGNGGTRVRSGMDADRDGILSETEVQAVEYVCNGADGLQGEQGPPGTAVQFFGQQCSSIAHVIGFDEVGNILCSDGNAGGVGADCPHNLVAGADLRNCDLRDFCFEGALFEVPNAILYGANFSGSNCGMILAPGADAQFANFEKIIAAIEMPGANLTGASFDGAEAVVVNFVNAILVGASAIDADLFGDYTGANLLNADFTGANLSGSQWGNTTCPDGSNSDNNGGTCIGYGL